MVTSNCIVEKFILGRLIATDCYVEPLCRLGGPFLKSALEEVEAGCIRPGGKMEFLSERINYGLPVMLVVFSI